jgi:hypothetical protein
LNPPWSTTARKYSNCRTSIRGILAQHAAPWRSTHGTHRQVAPRRPQPACGDTTLCALWVTLCRAGQLLIRSAAFSPIIMQVMLGLIAGRNGMIDASATRRPCTPRTRSCGSTTAIGSLSGPILAVQAGW